MALDGDIVQRLQHLRAKLKKEQLDAVVVTNPLNRRYLSGFTGTAGAVLITQNEQRFIADFRYVEQARAQCAGFDVVKQWVTLEETLEGELRSLGVKRVGFEADYLTYADAMQYRNMESRIPGLEWVPTSGLT
ncbi:MAG: aminopeptidase P family N-terminal domain-containing protein, partial [Alicyclobacillus sp.]|nr:aminopeptidase P family N-terminal domain-containing protein [Alicyclobacillus sp.]